MITSRSSATPREPWADRFRIAAEDATASVTLDADALLQRTRRTTASPQPGPRPSRRPRGTNRRRVILVLGAAVAAALLALGAFPTSLLGLGPGPDPAAAAVRVEDGDTNYTITFGNLGAEPRDIEAALHEQGVNISVMFVPASPSVVGTLTALQFQEDVAVERIIATYRDGSEEAEDLVSMTIPKNVAPGVVLTMGRRANGDEEYASVATSAGLPGEALHCVPLTGKVRDLLPALRATGVDLLWRSPDGSEVPAAAVEDDYVESALPWSQNTVLITTLEAPPDPATTSLSFTRLLQQGC